MPKFKVIDEKKREVPSTYSPQIFAGRKIPVVALVSSLRLLYKNDNLRVPDFRITRDTPGILEGEFGVLGNHSYFEASLSFEARIGTNFFYMSSSKYMGHREPVRVLFSSDEFHLQKPGNLHRLVRAMRVFEHFGSDLQTVYEEISEKVSAHELATILSEVR